MTTSILNDEKYHLLLDEDDLNVGETARDRPRPSQIWTIKSTLILLGTLCTFSVILNIFVLVQKPHHEGTKWGTLMCEALASSRYTDVSIPESSSPGVRCSNSNL